MSTMRLFHYAHFLSGFDYKIEYRASSANGNADYLSRFPVDTSTNKIDQHTAFQLNQINILKLNRNIIAAESSKYTEFHSLISALNTGTDLHTFGYNENELTLQDGCILFGTRIMIPKNLRTIVLKELHEGHLGILKMKLLARSYVHWKGIDRDIENLVKNCRECQLTHNEPAKVQIHHWEEPTMAWQRIHIDFAGPIQ
jgi:hypothetical protein